MIICVQVSRRAVEKPRVYYRFDLDRGKDGWCYRSRTSHNSFFHSGKARNWFPNREDWEILYGSKSQEDVDFEIKLLKDCGVIMPVEYIDCKDIWDFYDKIGWNYKAKKWSKK